MTLDRVRPAGSAPRIAGVMRLPVFVAGRWSAAVARAARVASRGWFAARGQVEARETIDDEGTVFERVEVTIVAHGDFDPMKGTVRSYRLVRDRGADFLVGDVGVEIARLEPVLAYLPRPFGLGPYDESVAAGGEAQDLVARATTLFPELAGRLVYGVRVRRALLRAGEEVEVRGERCEWIDPTVDGRAYREIPVRVAVRGTETAPALLFRP